VRSKFARAKQVRTCEASLHVRSKFARAKQVCTYEASLHVRSKFARAKQVCTCVASLHVRSKFAPSANVIYDQIRLRQILISLQPKGLYSRREYTICEPALKFGFAKFYNKLRAKQVCTFCERNLLSAKLIIQITKNRLQSSIVTDFYNKLPAKRVRRFCERNIYF